ncbi:hypothetical protein EYC84_009128 [Monilinia fructicola]|uniref:Uncharacterized protein n=1 Tax=Monilinia fructicola TaxID=38448 RepID=A0A5M9JFI5_MONFR|nr:hypothetical protein EYC84_009128 [Monilinia fructicola]
MKNESYVDKTQGFLVKAWNLSSWPAYQSRLGWGKETGNGNGNGGKVEARKPTFHIYKSSSLQDHLWVKRNSSGVTANTGLLGKNWIWGWIGAFIRFCITAPFSFVLQDRRGSHKSLKGHTWWSKVIANNA